MIILMTLTHAFETEMNNNTAFVLYAKIGNELSLHMWQKIINDNIY